MNFDKLPRSYCTPDGCRLATYEEATNGLDTIKEKGLLEKWERARLLDGWISGPGYHFQMGNDYRWCMAFMLVIKLDEQANVASGTLYKDITLSKNQKEVALLLCREDWNYEVVYWVLNSLSGSETMDLADVAHGNIPFYDSAKFKKMNTFIHNIAQKFVKEGPAAEKAKKRKFSDPNSVREVLSGMIGFLKEKERRTMRLWKRNMETILDSRLERLIDMSLENTWIGDVASQGGVIWEAIADAFWNFLSEGFALSMVNRFAVNGSEEIYRFTNQWDRNAITSSQGNFTFASHVLSLLCSCGDEIIHSPVQENGEFNPAKLILCYSSEKVKQQPERLSNMLQANALGRCYEESGNYEVLDKLLIFASKRQAVLQRGRKADIFVINRLLECGAKPGRSLRSRNSKTALHYAAKLEDEKVARWLLEKCDTNQQESFVNAQDNKGRTALHRATELGTKPLCELFLSYGARLDVQDKRGKTVVDIAVGDGTEEIIDLFAPLVCKSDKPDAYSSNVDLGQLLRQSLLKGYVQMVRVLLNNGEKLPGDDDDQGITTLHLAAMCENEKAAKKMVDMILLSNQPENLINAQDKIGKTALHRATELGNKPLCELLLSYGARLDARDKQGETVLDSAVRDGNEEIIDLFAQLVCKSDKPEAYSSNVDLGQLLRQSLLKGYVKIVRMLLNKGEELLGDDDDDQGRTTLHLAAMCENAGLAKEMVDMILAESEDKGKSVAKLDGRGRTVLHEAALKGHASLCKDLLDLNPNLINVEDKYGRNALYDAVQCKVDSIGMWKAMYGVFRKRGGKLDDVKDRRGLTPLHVAAEQGRRKILKHLLTSENVEIAAAKSGDRDTLDILKQADILGQTALHKAARLGDKRTVEILLENGADPFEERDCDGRTALHYVVEIAESGKGGKELAELLVHKCKSDKERLLFLWASAAGVGPADQNLIDAELKKFLSEQKNRLKEILDEKPYNLLQIAASIGHTGMTKELLSRGFHIADIQNGKWLEELTPEEQQNVKRVSTELKRIAEQGNDQPTIQDNLERRDYAHGLAALLLNPFLKPSITVGISGDWGKGKSSIMIQTERILLETVSQLAILPSPQLSRSTSDFPGVKVLQLSKEGKKRAQEIKRQLDMREGGLFAAATSEIGTMAKTNHIVELQGQNTDSLVEFLRKFLSNYEPKYRHIFKALAVMDSTKMLFEAQTKFLATERSVPAIITVQYNAWKYRNETEALAGLAVEITKEIEGSMTDPQWLTTCFRNAWRKHKHRIWLYIIFPCLLAILLFGSFIWIVWLVFEKYKMEEWAKAKYACVPAAIVVVVWILAKSVMGVLTPVSTQLMNYIAFPDHADKLGYQDRVISDINFLKDEIGKKPSMRCTAMVILWHLFVTLWFAALYFFPKCFAALSSFPKFLRNAGTNMKCRPADFLKICSDSVKICQLVISLKLWFAIFSFFRDCLGTAGTNMKFPPASSKDLRIIVFVDDLDRCQESVILQVLAAINLVLAVCEINVVLGMDKALIERAITKKHGDSKSKSSKLADNYLQKIIQLPLDLPDPSDKQLTKFLESHMGLKAYVPDGKMSTEPNISRTTTHGTDGEDQPRFPPPPASSGFMNVETPRQEIEIIFAGIEEGIGAREIPRQPGAPDTSDEQNTDKTDHCSCSTIFQGITGRKGINKIPPKQRADTNKTGNNPISIREMLFVTYSSGEWDAICHFKEFATNCRKLPREWKRFLNYHRLVWNIFSINVAEKPLVGWQVELISWIFICWEWKENMDILIQDWLNVGVLKFLKSEKSPSLGRIVEHFIEECGSNNENRNGKDKVNDGVAQAEQSNMDNKMAQTSQQGDTDQKAQDRQEKESLLDQPEVEMKVEMRAMKEELLSMRKSLEELKKTINELKLGQGTKQVTPKNENKVDRSKIKQKDMPNWRRLRSALDKYDVTMDGIEAFQRFRFHCVPGHLQWPLPKQEW